MKIGDIRTVKVEHNQLMSGRIIKEVKILKIGSEEILIANLEAEDVLHPSFIWGSWVKPELLEPAQIEKGEE